MITFTSIPWQNAIWDAIISAPNANSLIPIRICTDPNQKNLKFRTKVLNFIINKKIRLKQKIFVPLALGLGILDSALHLTQYDIIKELALGADRMCYDRIEIQIN